jgi:hypothetical protein
MYHYRRHSLNKTKTTGHIEILLLVLFLALVALTSTPAGAVDLHLTIANDPIFGNQEQDDLYTAGLAISMQRGFRHFTAGERMFTDREAGQRFDETFLAAEQRLANWGAWQPTVGLGLIHVGQGLLGQSVQNSIHEAIGSDRLDLDYLERSRYFGELMARLERSDLLGRGRLVTTTIELRSAPGFRSWLRAMAYYEATFGKHFAWKAGLGVHAEEAQLSLLEKNVEQLAPAAELGIAWRSLTLLWSYNDLGTASSHLTLGMNLLLKRPAGERPSYRP